MKNQDIDKIINEILQVIPIGEYGYTDNVISKKDIDKLISNINFLRDND